MAVRVASISSNDKRLAMNGGSDTGSVEAPRNPSTRAFIVGVISLSLLMGVSIGYTRVITVLFAVQLNAQGWMLGAVALCQSIGMLVLAATAGRWVSAHGPRPVFLLGSAWALLVCLLTPLVPTLWALLLFTAAASLAMPLRFVSINTVFMSRLGEIGQHRAGWFRAAHVIGMTFLGAVTATTLFPVLGLRATFWLGAAVFGLNIVVLLLGIRPEVQIGRTATPSGTQHSPLQLLKERLPRQVAAWEFSIQALNAYFTFYIVVIVLRYLQLPERVAGFTVGVHGVAFVWTLAAFGSLVLANPNKSRVLAGVLIVSALVGYAVAREAPQLYGCAAMLGSGLGLLQLLNLSAFGRLGEAIGFSQAASINALSGPSGGVLGGLLGGLLEPWISPQLVFLVFIPLFALLALKPPHLSCSREA